LLLLLLLLLYIYYYYYYCYYYYCYCTFAYNLVCRDDCDENLVFDSVVGCGELVGIKDYKELISVVSGEELGEKDLEFSENSIEGFFLLVKLEEALVWCGVCLYTYL
jgi:hypothetical protein